MDDLRGLGNFIVGWIAADGDAHHEPSSEAIIRGAFEGWLHTDGKCGGAGLASMPTDEFLSQIEADARKKVHGDADWIVKRG